MGAFFSLRGAEEWERAVSETMEPSIWTNVAYTPLSKSQKTLLHRGQEVSFSFPSGISHDGDVICMSEVVDLSLVVGFQESVGRFYSGLLVHAPLPEQPHSYRRAVESVSLKGPGSVPAGAAPSQAKAAPGGGNEIFSGLSLSQCGAEEVGSVSAEWPYLLLYAVKEGILAHFAADYESCEEVIREIASSYGPAAGAASPTKSPPRDEVKCVRFPVGRAPPPVGRVFTELLGSDLKREFAIRCEADEQSQSTNCVVFCLRMMLGMKMSVRGFDIAGVCEGRPDLGPMVGRAAGEAWEVLWRRVRI